MCYVRRYLWQSGKINNRLDFPCNKIPTLLILPLRLNVEVGAVFAIASEV